MEDALGSLTERPYFAFTVVFSTLMYLLDSVYLSYRQRRVFLRAQLPSELEQLVSKEEFEKSRQYQIDKTSFSLWHGAFHHLLMLKVLFTGWLPLLWYFSADHAAALGFSDSEIISSLIFLVLNTLVDTMLDLPWTVYFTFVIEQRHGFNRQTAGFFIRDQLKQLLLTIVLTLFVTSALIYVIRWGGEYFFLYAWLVVVTFSVTLATVYADYIAPLFDKFTELPTGELRTMIEALANKLSFPLKKLYLVEGSKRSSHSNAYLSGMFKNKRIVLYDTLFPAAPPVAGPDATEDTSVADEKKSVEKKVEEKQATATEEPQTVKRCGCTNEEILAILAHELGHWQKSHVARSLTVVQMYTFFIIFGFGQFMHNKEIYADFGFIETQPVLIGLVLITSFLFAPFNSLANYFITAVTRRHEFQADEYAVKLGHGAQLSSALVKLEKDNLGFPVSDWLFSALHRSHPTLLERMRFISELEKKSE